MKTYDSEYTHLKKKGIHEKKMFSKPAKILIILKY